LAEEKEFVFPMNYKKKEKFLGIIDYKTAAVIGAIAAITFFILKNLKVDIVVSITVFIVTVGFFSILILIGVNGENMLDFLYFAVKHLINEKVYVYRKTEEKKGGGICVNPLNRYSR